MSAQSPSSTNSSGNRRPVIVVVDGVIGAGKTTLIRECLLPALTERGWKVTEVREPVDRWKKNGRLQQFYEDPNRRAYQFQTMAFHDRIHECMETYERYGTSSDVFILERSIFTDILFMKMLLMSKTIDQTEYDDYLALWNMWDRVMPFQPDLFVYLKPSITECMKRLRERNREGETGVSEEYQSNLLKVHDQFLGKSSVKIGRNHYVPRLLLETNDNFRDCLDTKQRVSQEIANMIKTIMES